MTFIHAQPCDISFSDFLDVGLYLKKTDMGVRGLYINNGTSVEVDFTHEQIDEVDPRLSNAIKVIFSQLQSPGDGLNVSWVSDTLRYWNNPLLLTEHNGGPVPIASLAKIHKCNEKDQTVTVTGNMFYEHEADGVRFSAGTRAVEFKVKWGELEKHFPGWKVRYDLLSALSTPDDELVKTVCTKAEGGLRSNITLHEVNFE